MIHPAKKLAARLQILILTLPAVALASLDICLRVRLSSHQWVPAEMREPIRQNLVPNLGATRTLVLSGTKTVRKGSHHSERSSVEQRLKNRRLCDLSQLPKLNNTE